MDSFTFPDMLTDDFTATLKIDDITSTVSTTGQWEKELPDLFDGLEFLPDTAMAASAINPSDSIIMTTQDHESSLDLPAATFELDQYELPEDPMPSISTPGFVVLQSEAPGISARRPRKPREYFPSPASTISRSSLETDAM